MRRDEETIYLTPGDNKTEKVTSILAAGQTAKKKAIWCSTPKRANPNRRRVNIYIYEKTYSEPSSYL